MKAEPLELVQIPLFCSKSEIHYSKPEARLHLSSKLVDRLVSSQHSLHWVEIVEPLTCELTPDLRQLQNLWLLVITTWDKNTSAKKLVSIITVPVTDVLPQRSKKLMIVPGKWSTRRPKLQTTVITSSNEINKFKSTRLKGIRILMHRNSCCSEIELWSSPMFKSQAKMAVI